MLSVLLNLLQRSILFIHSVCSAFLSQGNNIFEVRVGFEPTSPSYNARALPITPPDYFILSNILNYPTPHVLLFLGLMILRTTITDYTYSDDAQYYNLAPLWSSFVVRTGLEPVIVSISTFVKADTPLFEVHYVTYSNVSVRVPTRHLTI